LWNRKGGSVNEAEAKLLEEPRRIYREAVAAIENDTSLSQAEKERRLVKVWDEHNKTIFKVLGYAGDERA
jgi:hypothetical protein